MQTIRDSVTDTWKSLADMDRRQLAHQILNLGLIVCSAIMIWKALIVVSNCESPVVVVLSGSMLPAMGRGDILFLWLDDAPFTTGEIIVYKVADRPIPIIHRIIEVHTTPSGEQEVLTKGDNNPHDDLVLYSPGQMWLTKPHIVGRAKALLPYVGMVTIVLTEYPYLKFLVIGIMAIFVITSKDGGLCGAWASASHQHREMNAIKTDVMQLWRSFSAMNQRKLIQQVLSLALIVSTAIVIWKGMILVSGSESPVVVVLSSSMEPALHRGDILFLWNDNGRTTPTTTTTTPLRVGEIVVFKIDGRDIPIVHRIIELHDKTGATATDQFTLTTNTTTTPPGTDGGAATPPTVTTTSTTRTTSTLSVNATGSEEILTKGDNNSFDDRTLYGRGQLYLSRREILGRAIGVVPYIGLITIQLTDFPAIKYIILAVVGFIVIASPDNP